MIFFAFFLQKIWSDKKKVLPLQRQIKKMTEFKSNRSIHKCIFYIPEIRNNSQITTNLLTTKIMPL